MAEAGPYNARVAEHFARPRNVAGELEPGWRTGSAGGLERGVWMRFDLCLNAAGRVEKARFRAYGCPHSIALASWLTEILPGQVPDADFTLDRRDVMEALELPVTKTHSILVAEDAIRAAGARTEETSDSSDTGRG